jgi:hypothetical protein
MQDKAMRARATRARIAKFQRAFYVRRTELPLESR